MYLLCLLVITSVPWTQEHLTFPVNYCDLAKACVHDNRMVCATSENNCIRRTFLDQCDMYEYNCDYHAGFRQMYTLFCFGSNLILLSPNLHPTTSKTIITCPTECITNIITKFTTTAYISTVTFKTTNPLTKIVTATTFITTTILKISTSMPKTTTTTMPKTSTTMPKTTTTTITTTPKTTATLPKSTTTIDSVTSIMTTITTTNIPKTTNTTKNTTLYQKTTPMTNYNATTITTTTPVVTTFEEKTSKTETITNACEYNCNRPVSWITTASTKKTLPATYNERNSDSVERNEPTSTLSTITQPSTTVNITTETNTDDEPQQNTHNKLTVHTTSKVSINTLTTQASVPSPLTTTNNSTELSSINIIWKETESEIDNIVNSAPIDSDSDLKSITPNIDKLTFKVDRTLCEHNCRRPKTWITKIKKSKRLKYHGYQY